MKLARRLELPAVDATFTVALVDTSSDIEVRDGTTIPDAVTYTSVTSGVAPQRAPTSTKFCNATATSGDASNTGTPRAANASCPQRTTMPLSGRLVDLDSKVARTYTTQMVKYAWLLVGTSMVVACAPSPVSTMRMGGVFPARPASCELELRMGTLTMELTSSYDTVGVVIVRGEDGEAPNAPRLLKLLKPEACGLGGEVVTINSSANIQNAQTRSTSSSHSYIVLRKKAAGPVAPQTF